MKLENRLSCQFSIIAYINATGGFNVERCKSVVDLCLIGLVSKAALESPALAREFRGIQTKVLLFCHFDGDGLEFFQPN